MSISSQIALNGAPGAQMVGTQGSGPQVEIYENEGKVYIKSEAAESGHEMAFRHCKHCFSGFQFLKSQAKTGQDGGLFAIAVKQAEQAQKALGQVAQPGPGPLEGLSPSGGLRVDQAVAAPSQTERVSLSRSARVRRTPAMRAVNPIQVSVTSTGAELPSDPKDKTAARAETTSRQATGVEVAANVPAQPTPNAKDDTASGAVEQAVSPNADAEEYAVVEPTEKSSTDDGKEHGEFSSAKDSESKRLKKTNEQELTPDEERQVQELKDRDHEVRAHEQAHKSAAGPYGGAISLSYQTGPDGKRYAVGGEVPVDIAPIKGDPEATLQKMQTIQRAALAPAEPSGADRRIASRASAYATEARADILQNTREELNAPKELKKKDDDGAEETKTRDQAQERTRTNSTSAADPKNNGKSEPVHNQPSGEMRQVAERDAPGAMTESTASDVGSVRPVSTPPPATPSEAIELTGIQSDSPRLDGHDPTSRDEKARGLSKGYSRYGQGAPSGQRTATFNVFA